MTRRTQSLHVGNTIRDLCVARGWTPQELSAHSGVNIYTLTRMLRSAGFLNQPTTDIVLKSLGVSRESFESPAFVAQVNEFQAAKLKLRRACA